MKNYKFVNLISPSVAPIKQIDIKYRPEKWVYFGNDNLFPQAVAAVNRSSPVHRGIINNKTTYALGGGLLQNGEPLEIQNAVGQDINAVVNNCILDYFSFGNAYMEIVTNGRQSFYNIYHIDSTTARVSKDMQSVWLHPRWAEVVSNKTDLRNIPLYPNFGKILDSEGKEIKGDKSLHSIIHIKDYEPEFYYYGIVPWLAGMNAATIAYKTDKWNLSRLDNSFLTSGILNVVAPNGGDEAIKEMKKEFEKEMTGEGAQGKIMLILTEPNSEGSKYTPITTDNDGDWVKLSDHTTDTLITAHGWFRSLSGINDNTGFDTKRILQEYEVAKNTVIYDTQSKFISILEKITGLEDITFKQKQPISLFGLLDANLFTTVGEARQMAGLEDLDNEETNNKFLSDGKSSNTSSGS